MKVRIAQDRFDLRNVPIRRCTKRPKPMWAQMMVVSGCPLKTAFTWLRYAGSGSSFATSFAIGISTSL